MNTVTITKTQYEGLKRQAEAYRQIISVASTDLFVPPPTRDAKKVISAMRQTKRYSKAFLDSVERGLARSAYFRK
ncbi:MAG: hypothetical protein Q7S01_04990 [bacterium]|nr:hypothetical protein [bacterium]